MQKFKFLEFTKYKKIACQKPQAIFLFCFLAFWQINLSKVASNIGRRIKINRLEQIVPWEIVVQILEVMEVEKWPTIKVTKIKIEALVKIVWMELL